MVRETRHLWIGNLPENVREEHILDLFQRHGRVQSVKLLDEDVCSLRGSRSGHRATVSFIDIRSASKALRAGPSLSGQILTIGYHEPGSVPDNPLLGSSQTNSNDTPTPPPPLPNNNNYNNSTNNSLNRHQRPFPHPQSEDGSSHFYEAPKTFSRGRGDGHFHGGRGRRDRRHGYQNNRQGFNQPDRERHYRHNNWYSNENRFVPPVPVEPPESERTLNINNNNNEGLTVSKGSRRSTSEGENNSSIPSGRHVPPPPVPTPPKRGQSCRSESLSDSSDGRSSCLSRSLSRSSLSSSSSSSSRSSPLSRSPSPPHPPPSSSPPPHSSSISTPPPINNSTTTPSSINTSGTNNTKSSTPPPPSSRYSHHHSSSSSHHHHHHQHQHRSSSRQMYNRSRLVSRPADSSRARRRSKPKKHTHNNSSSSKKHSSPSSRSPIGPSHSSSSSSSQSPSPNRKISPSHSPSSTKSYSPSRPLSSAPPLLPRSGDSPLPNGGGSVNISTRNEIGSLVRIRNLPLRSSDTSLKDGLFHEYKKIGKVGWVKVVGSGLERYALVAFKSSEGANRAVGQSIDKLFFGSKIQVTVVSGGSNGRGGEEGVLSSPGHEDDSRSQGEEGSLTSTPSRTLLINGLEPLVTATDLIKNFQQFGDIVDATVRKVGNESGCSGTVEFVDVSSAVKGQWIRSMIKSKECRISFSRSPPTSTLLLDGISNGLGEKQIVSHCSQYGAISKVVIDSQRLLALVTFKEISSAQAGYRELKNWIQKGRSLHVDYASPASVRLLSQRVNSLASPPPPPPSSLLSSPEDVSGGSVEAELHHHHHHSPETSSSTNTAVPLLLPLPSSSCSLVGGGGGGERGIDLNCHETDSALVTSSSDIIGIEKESLEESSCSQFYVRAPALVSVNGGDHYHHHPLSTYEKIVDVVKRESSNSNGSHHHHHHRWSSKSCGSLFDGVSSTSPEPKTEAVRKSSPDSVLMTLTPLDPTLHTTSISTSLEDEIKGGSESKVRRSSADSNLLQSSGSFSSTISSASAPSSLLKAGSCSSLYNCSEGGGGRTPETEESEDNRPGTPLCDENPELFTPLPKNSTKTPPHSSKPPLLSEPLPPPPPPHNEDKESEEEHKSPPGFYEEEKIEEGSPKSPPHFKSLSFESRAFSHSPTSPLSHSGSSPDSPTSLLEEGFDKRINDIFERFDAWDSKNRCGKQLSFSESHTPTNTTPSEGSSTTSRFSSLRKVFDFEELRHQPSDITKNLIAKKSIFDEDIKRLESANDETSSSTTTNWRSITPSSSSSVFSPLPKESTSSLPGTPLTPKLSVSKDHPRLLFHTKGNFKSEEKPKLVAQKSAPIPNSIPTASISKIVERSVSLDPIKSPVLGLDTKKSVVLPPHPPLSQSLSVLEPKKLVVPEIKTEMSPILPMVKNKEVLKSPEFEPKPPRKNINITNPVTITPTLPAVNPCNSIPASISSISSTSKIPLHKETKERESSESSRNSLARDKESKEMPKDKDKSQTSSHLFKDKGESRSNVNPKEENKKPSSGEREESKKSGGTKPSKKVSVVLKEKEKESLSKNSLVLVKESVKISEEKEKEVSVRPAPSLTIISSPSVNHESEGGSGGESREISKGYRESKESKKLKKGKDESREKSRGSSKDSQHSKERKSSEKSSKRRLSLGAEGEPDFKKQRLEKDYSEPSFSKSHEKEGSKEQRKRVKDDKVNILQGESKEKEPHHTPHHHHHHHHRSKSESLTSSKHSSSSHPHDKTPKSSSSSTSSSHKEKKKPKSSSSSSIANSSENLTLAPPPPSSSKSSKNSSKGSEESKKSSSKSSSVEERTKKESSRSKEKKNSESKEKRKLEKSSSSSKESKSSKGRERERAKQKSGDSSGSGRVVKKKRSRLVEPSESSERSDSEERRKHHSIFDVVVDEYVSMYDKVKARSNRACKNVGKNNTEEGVSSKKEEKIKEQILQLKKSRAKKGMSQNSDDENSDASEKQSHMSLHSNQSSSDEGKSPQQLHEQLKKLKSFTKKRSTSGSRSTSKNSHKKAKKFSKSSFILSNSDEDSDSISPYKRSKVHTPSLSVLSHTKSDSESEAESVRKSKSMKKQEIGSESEGSLRSFKSMSSKAKKLKSKRESMRRIFESSDSSDEEIVKPKQRVVKKEKESESKEESKSRPKKKREKQESRESEKVKKEQTMADFLFGPMSNSSSDEGETEKIPPPKKEKIEKVAKVVEVERPPKVSQPLPIVPTPQKQKREKVSKSHKSTEVETKSSGHKDEEKRRKKHTKKSKNKSESRAPRDIDSLFSTPASSPTSQIQPPVQETEPNSPLNSLATKDEPVSKNRSMFSSEEEDENEVRLKKEISVAISSAGNEDGDDEVIFIKTEVKNEEEPIVEEPNTELFTPLQDYLKEEEQKRNSLVEQDKAIESILQNERKSPLRLPPPPEEEERTKEEGISSLKEETISQEETEDAVAALLKNLENEDGGGSVEEKEEGGRSPPTLRIIEETPPLELSWYEYGEKSPRGGGGGGGGGVSGEQGVKKKKLTCEEASLELHEVLEQAKQAVAVAESKKRQEFELITSMPPKIFIPEEPPPSLSHTKNIGECSEIPHGPVVPRGNMLTSSDVYEFHDDSDEEKTKKKLINVSITVPPSVVLTPTPSASFVHLGSNGPTALISPTNAIASHLLIPKHQSSIGSNLGPNLVSNLGPRPKSPLTTEGILEIAVEKQPVRGSLVGPETIGHTMPNMQADSGANLPFEGNGTMESPSRHTFTSSPPSITPLVGLAEAPKISGQDVSSVVSKSPQISVPLVHFGPSSQQQQAQISPTPKPRICQLIPMPSAPTSRPHLSSYGTLTTVPGHIAPPMTTMTQNNQISQLVPNAEIKTEMLGEVPAIPLLPIGHLGTKQSSPVRSSIDETIEEVIRNFRLPDWGEIEVNTREEGGGGVGQKLSPRGKGKVKENLMNPLQFEKQSPEDLHMGPETSSHSQIHENLNLKSSHPLPLHLSKNEGLLSLTPPHSQMLPETRKIEPHQTLQQQQSIQHQQSIQQQQQQQQNIMHQQIRTPVFHLNPSKSPYIPHSSVSSSPQPLKYPQVSNVFTPHSSSPVYNSSGSGGGGANIQLKALQAQVSLHVPSPAQAQAQLVRIPQVPQATTITKVEGRGNEEGKRNQPLSTVILSTTTAGGEGGSKGLPHANLQARVHALSDTKGQEKEAFGNSPQGPPRIEISGNIVSNAVGSPNISRHDSIVRISSQHKPHDSPMAISRHQMESPHQYYLGPSSYTPYTSQSHRSASVDPVDKMVGENSGPALERLQPSHLSSSAPLPSPLLADRHSSPFPTNLPLKLHSSSLLSPLPSAAHQVTRQSYPYEFEERGLYARSPSVYNHLKEGESGSRGSSPLLGSGSGIGGGGRYGGGREIDLSVGDSRGGVGGQQGELLLLLQRYPIVWNGQLALKNDNAACQFHFVSGNMGVATDSLSLNPDGPNSPLRISQRMRLEQTQLDGVARKLQFEQEHCIILALPCGRDHIDVLQQSNNLRTGFITYLQLKQAAGIVNVHQHSSSDQPSFVIHIFPSCDFANENLARIAPDLLNGVADIAHLFIVIATV